ncbi:AAA family ATPase [Peribacillus asahii]|uniref:AAA family ATPase n=1 Tax=Peribacillus asahii TaxID=228899 RepID=UPI0038029D97
MIKELVIEDWNQFERINLEFHPRLTIITGANGSGKSTIIRLISRIIGWSYNETGVPSASLKANSRFLSGISLDKLMELLESNSQPNINGGFEIGKVETENGGFKILVPNQTNQASYSVNFSSYGNPEQIKGVSIPSHRLPYAYTALKSIPVRSATKKEAYSLYAESLKKRIIPGSYYNPTDDSPTLHIKSTLISLAVFGKGNDHVTGNEESYKLFRDFVKILRVLLPETLGFKDINIKDGELLLLTDTGEFLLDSVSGGIGAIIDLAWQLYMFDDGESSPFVALVDEAENHLHPSMQRSLLPKLLKAFPKVQFIVTTHSPFIISSVIDSRVYAFKYNENNKVDSHKLDFEYKAANAMEILRDVLGVPVTLPIWVEDKLNNVIERYRGVELTAESYVSLKKDLKEVGLNEHMPQALGLLQGGSM